MVQGREVNIIAGVGATMMSLLLLVIVYADTHTWNDEHMQ